MLITSNKTQMTAVDTQLTLAFAISKILKLPKFYLNFSQALFEKQSKEEAHQTKNCDVYNFLLYRANNVMGTYFVPDDTLGLYELKDFGKLSYFRKRFFSSRIKKQLLFLAHATGENDKWATMVLRFGDNKGKGYDDLVSELRSACLAFVNVDEKNTTWMTKEHKALREALTT